MIDLLNVKLVMNVLLASGDDQKSIQSRIERSFRWLCTDSLFEYFYLVTRHGFIVYYIYNILYIAVIAPITYTQNPSHYKMIKKQN